MIKFLKTPDSSEYCKYDNTSVEMIVNDSNVTWVELLQEFKCFLRALGHFFSDEDFNDAVNECMTPIEDSNVVKNYTEEEV